jgi:4'-phosphopantetheinyl transferase
MNNFETKVYIAKTDELYDDALFGKLYNTVSRQRRAKIDRLRFSKDKCLSLAAELLLIKALRDTGIDSFEIEISRGGKPHLKNSDIFFNLSHSEERAMCVISPYEVGCDTEKITDIDMEIPKRFFCKSEYERLMKISDSAARREMFFRLWTLKESFVKQLGTGMETLPNSFEILIGGADISVVQNINDRKYSFKEYDFNDGYKYAVCAMSAHFAKPEFVTFN